MNQYWVYILSNDLRTVYYTGVTNNIERRILEHKAQIGSGYTERYNCTNLLYIEEFGNIQSAINYEKKLKRWKRAWKENIIQEENELFEDLAKDWFSSEDLESVRGELLKGK